MRFSLAEALPIGGIGAAERARRIGRAPLMQRQQREHFEALP